MKNLSLNCNDIYTQETQQLSQTMYSPLLDPENQTPGRKKRKFSVASDIMDDTMPGGVNHKDEVREI